MKLFAISDLHLSFGADKPMDVFYGWDNYVERIKANWNTLVSQEDTVVLAGDTSWAIKPEDALLDFKFIEALNGKKIILKGNHDYWWGTVSKMKEFFQKNDINSVDILHNNAFRFGDISICGTRGWVYDGTGTKDEKVIRRECGRLEASIKQGLALGGKPMVFLHYPPVYGQELCEEIFSVIKQYGITHIYYGHIHGAGFNKALSEYEGIKMKLISCDCVDFTPIFISQYMEND